MSKLSVRCPQSELQRTPRATNITKYAAYHIGTANTLTAVRHLNATFRQAMSHLALRDGLSFDECTIGTMCERAELENFKTSFLKQAQWYFPRL